MCLNACTEHKILRLIHIFNVCHDLYGLFLIIKIIYQTMLSFTFLHNTYGFQSSKRLIRVQKQNFFSVQAQTMSIIMNLLKVSIVTTLYQRFKTQKIGGKDYPWYKAEKLEYGKSEDVVDAVATRSTFKPPRRRRTGIIYATRENAARLKREYESLNNTPVPTAVYSRGMLRRTSSDLYLIPSGIDQDEVSFNYNVKFDLQLSRIRR